MIYTIIQRQNFFQKVIPLVLLALILQARLLLASKNRGPVFACYKHCTRKWMRSKWFKGSGWPLTVHMCSVRPQQTWELYFAILNINNKLNSGEGDWTIPSCAVFHLPNIYIFFWWLFCHFSGLFAVNKFPTKERLERKLREHSR